MAISSDKLLNRPSELHRRYGGRLAMQEAQQQKMIGGGPSNVVLTKKSVKDIASIKVNVIKIEGILKGTLAAEKKALDNKKRQESGKRREKQEEKLETKPQAQKGRIKVPSLPRMGFLDWVKNFIGNVILGYFALRMLEYLPKIKPIIKFIGSSADFLIGAGGNLLNGLASFIDWGYKAVDATNGFIKKIGGQGAVDNFGKFIGLIDSALFLTTTLAASMAVEALTSDSGGPGGGITRPGTGGRPRVTTSGGGAAGRPDIRNPFRQRPTVTTGGKPQFRLPGTRPSITGSGAKGVLSSVRPFLKRIPLPVVGALIDFGLSVALGEDPGRAAFKSIGAGILGGVGAALGGPFAILTGLAGGMLGDWAGGALYDMFFGGKKPQQNNKKIQGKAGGGITRGGKAQTGARRIIGGNRKRGKYKRVLKQEPQKTQFKTDPKKEPAVNTAKKLDETKYFGPILSAANKLNLKEELTQRDYKNVGLGLNSLLAKGIEDGQLKGGLVAAFAEGGLVDDKFLEATEKGTDLSGWISKTFQSVFETNAQKTLRMIRERRELDKKEKKAPDPMNMGEGFGVQVSSDSPDFWLLATAAMFENSDPQGAADVAQAIYNRVAMPGDPWKVNNSISKAILDPGQFQPVSDYGGASVWGRIKTKQDALSFIKNYGKSQAQLESVAAALLDENKQKSARQFVGPRDSFRSVSYEDKNNHLADDTEVRRLGHAFGFEPRGATIGMFKSGQLSAAVVNGSVNLKPGDGRFIQGNSGRSEGTHFHIGTNKPGDGSGVASAGFNVIKNFLGKKSVYVGRSGETIPANATDEQIRGYIGRGQAAHATRGRGPTELDLQIGGTGAGNKVAFPLALKGMKYSSSDGYGVSADIVGTNAFVGHGRYKPDGSLAPQQKLVLNMGAPDYYAFHGKSFGIVPKGGMRLTLHEGEMYKVIDKDSVKLLGYDLTKDIIDIENRAQLVAKAPSIIQRLKAISGYADYEHPYGGEMSTQVIVVEKVVPQRIDSGSSILISSGGSRNRFNELYGSK